MSDIVVSDTSILINFLKIDQMKLLKESSYRFVVTDHVRKEIADHYIDQKQRFEYALNDKIIEMERVDSSIEWEIFKQFKSGEQLGAGECSAIALAYCRGYKIALDDLKAIKKISHIFSAGFILRTQDLIIHLIHEDIIDIDTADKIREELASKHRFKMNIPTFCELV